MESTNLSLKSLDWSSLLKETSEDSCDSDETNCGAIEILTNKNHFQYFDQNSNKQHEGKTDHKPMVKETLDTIISNQNTAFWPNEEGHPNRSVQNVQFNLAEGFRVNNEPQITDSYDSSFNFSGPTMPENNNILERNVKKHRFESDFSFTDMSCKDTNIAFLNNVTLQPTDFCSISKNLFLQRDCNSNNEPEEFGLDRSCIIIKNNEDQSKPLDSELNMCLEAHEMYGENTLALATGADYLPLEEQSTNEFQSAMTADGFLEGLTQNIDQIMSERSLDDFMRCGEEIPQRKSCSPPLTLTKGTRRKVLPADKVLPNYRKKNRQAEKKLLPTRRCSSAYIDLSNRNCEGVKGTEIIADGTKESGTISPTTVSEAQDVDVQPQTRKKYFGKQHEGEVTKEIRNGKVKQNFPNRVRVRGRKKKGVFGRVKQETERDSESASQELKKGVGEILLEIKSGLEYLEERVARWISGEIEDPPTREQAFKMLADTQVYIATLQHMKEKNESRKKCIQKCERKLENRLLERLQKLEISIDKLIAEADRLMIMERNEISEDSWTTGKEIVDKGIIKENKYLKPILKNSSSEPSTEEGFNNKRHIYFSEEIECRYLSCSEQSSSLGPSQSFYEQYSESSSVGDKKETNCIIRIDDNIRNNIVVGKSPNTSLTSSPYTSLTSARHHHQVSNPYETHTNPELEILSFQNLSIDPSNSSNDCNSELRQRFERKKNNCAVENICRINHLSLQTSPTESSFLMRNTENDENKKSKTETFLCPMDTVDTNCVQNNSNRNAYPGENKSCTQNYSSQLLFSIDYNNCDPVFYNTNCTNSQTTDFSIDSTTLPSNRVINTQKQESSIMESEKGNIGMERNNSLVCDQNRLSFSKTAAISRVLQSETDFRYPQAQLKVNVHSTGETLDCSENAFLKLSENSTQMSENFGFSEQSTQAEEEPWKSVTLMSIKSIRLKDPSEFMPVDSSDDWADLEDWSMCSN